MFKTLLEDKIILVSLLGALLFFLVTIFFTAFNYSHLPPFLPLYSKLPWGYARLGNKYEIVVPIITALGIVSINIFLGHHIYGKNPLLARFLFLIILLSLLFTCIFIVKMILVIL